MSYTLLIIDDDEDIRLILASVLASVVGLEILEAADGTTAQDLVKNTSVDGIILDYQLPDISGEALLQIFKSSHIVPQPEIIMLTARDNEDLTRRWIEMGAKAVLKKPFNPLELLAQLRVQLEF